MSKPSQSNAVLVAIRTPRVTAEEVDSSLQELTRLVKTLGYNVVGRVTQKRSSDRYAAVLGEGKLAELALCTGGPGKSNRHLVARRTRRRRRTRRMIQMSRKNQTRTNRTKPSRLLQALTNRRRS